MQPINVICDFRGFKTESIKYPLAPHSFELPDRTVKIKEIPGQLFFNQLKM